MPYYDVLTDARNAVWDAIDNHADTRDLFKKKFRFNDEGSCMTEPEPALSDLDAISIFPMSFVPKWYTNERQEWPYALRVVMWFGGWKVTRAETALLKVARAIQDAKPQGSSAAYINRVSGCNGVKVGPSGGILITRIREKENPIKVVKATLEFVLRCSFQPRTT